MCFCGLCLIFTSFLVKMYLVFVEYCIKTVLFFEKCFAFYGTGIIFALFLCLYKTSIKLIGLHLFDKIYKTTI